MRHEAGTAVHQVLKVCEQLIYDEHESSDVGGGGGRGLVAVLAAVVLSAARRSIRKYTSTRKHPRELQNLFEKVEDEEDDEDNRDDDDDCRRP